MGKRPVVTANLGVALWKKESPARELARAGLLTVENSSKN
jgi:hypothetical protein